MAGGSWGKGRREKGASFESSGTSTRRVAKGDFHFLYLITAMRRKAKGPSAGQLLEQNYRNVKSPKKESLSKEQDLGTFGTYIYSARGVGIFIKEIFRLEPISSQSTVVLKYSNWVKIEMTILADFELIT